MPHKSLIALFIVAIGCSSCGHQMDDKEQAFLNDGFKRTNLFIKEANNQVYTALAEKGTYTSTKWVAERWLPLAMRIRSLTATEDRYLDEVGSALRQVGHLAKGQRQEVLKSVAEYRKNVLMTFDSISLTNSYHLLKDELASLNSRLPLSKDSDFFADDPPISLPMLHQLKNDLDLSENMWIRFCDEQTVVLDASRPCPIALSNSSRVRPGQGIEVLAGMVRFMAIDQVMINGKSIKPDEEGLTVDTVIAKTRPGKYIIPVIIKVVKPDGTLSILTKNLGYTVEKGH